MNKERAARAYDTIAEGFAELAMAIREIEQPGSGVGVPPPAQAPAASLDEDPSALFDDGPAPTPIRGDQNVDNVLGQCPTHQKPWTVKPAGVSKTGKEYSAFYKCGERDSSTRSGYCDKKPVKAWLDAHPIAA